MPPYWAVIEHRADHPGAESGHRAEIDDREQDDRPHHGHRGRAEEDLPPADPV